MKKNVLSTIFFAIAISHSKTKGILGGMTLSFLPLLRFCHLILKKQTSLLQERIFKEFNEAAIQAEKDRDAQILSDLWHADLLKDEIKERLTQDHYQVVLRQIPSHFSV